MKIGESFEFGTWNGKSLRWYFLDVMKDGRGLFLCCDALLKTTFVNFDNVMIMMGREFCKYTGAKVSLMPINVANRFQKFHFMKLQDNDIIGLDWWLLPPNKNSMAGVLSEQFPPYFESTKGEIVRKGDRADSVKWFRPVIVLNSDWFEDSIRKGGENNAKESCLY